MKSLKFEVVPAKVEFDDDAFELTFVKIFENGKVEIDPLKNKNTNPFTLVFLYNGDLLSSQISDSAAQYHMNYFTRYSEASTSKNLNSDVLGAAAVPYFS